MKYTKPKSKSRTVMTEIDDIPHAGVYAIAYMGKVLYVGKSSISVFDRLRNHIGKPSEFGAWLRRVEGDWGNVRIDVLEQPDEAGNKWLLDVEEALIKRHRPMFNSVGL